MWHMSGRWGRRHQKAGEVSPFHVQLSWPAEGSSHLGIFFHSKGTQTCGRRVPQLPFGADRRQTTWRGYPGCPAPPASGCHPGAPCLPAVRQPGLLHLQGSPWERGPPPSAAASAPGPALLGSPGSARPLGASPRAAAAKAWRSGILPPLLPARASRSRHWACSVAGACAALSRKLACCNPQLIWAFSGLRDLGAGAGADRASRSAGWSICVGAAVLSSQACCGRICPALD